MEDLEGLQYLVQNIICAVKISVNTKAYTTTREISAI